MGYLGNAPADQAVQIGDGVVDTDQLAAGAVTGVKIENLAVDTEHIAASAVETAKINNDAVTGDKIENSPTIASNLTVTGNLAVTGAFPAGHVLQTVIGSNTAASTGTTAAHSDTPASWNTIVSCAITPSAVTSQILINFTVNIGGSGGSFALHILRGSQEVGQGDAASNRIRAYTSSGYVQPGDGNIYDLGSWSGVFLDDISDGTAWTTGSITYYIKYTHYVDTGTYRINRSEDDRDNASGYDGRSSSHILLQEISG